MLYDTMQHSRVTERRDGIEVAWSEEEKKGGEQKKGGEERRAGIGSYNGSREGRMGQGGGGKGSKRKLEVKELQADELSRGNGQVLNVAML